MLGHIVFFLCSKPYHNIYELFIVGSHNYTAKILSTPNLKLIYEKINSILLFNYYLVEAGNLQSTLTDRIQIVLKKWVIL